jgi:phage major head subunit gpT-like protein
MLASALGRRDIRGWFFHRFSEVTNASWISKIAHMFTSDQLKETYRFLGQSPSLTKTKGQRSKTQPNKYKIDVENELYDASIEFAIADMRREKVDQIKPRIRELARKAALLPKKQLVTLLEANGTSTYDGLALYADRSAVKTGGQFNNALTDASPADPDNLTSAEAEAIIIDQLEALYGALDDSGEPLNEDAKEFLLMYPVKYLGAMKAAHKNMFSSAGVSNTVKAMTEDGDITLTLVPNARMTKTAAAAGRRVHMFRTDADIKPMIWQDEVEADLDALAEGSDYEFHNLAHVYGVTREGAGGYGEPGLTVRTELS